MFPNMNGTNSSQGYFLKWVLLSISINLRFGRQASLRVTSGEAAGEKRSAAGELADALRQLELGSRFESVSRVN